MSIIYLQYSFTGCLKILEYFQFRLECGDSFNKQLGHAQREGFTAGVTRLLEKEISLEVEEVVIQLLLGGARGKVLATSI